MNYKPYRLKKDGNTWGIQFWNPKKVNQKTGKSGMPDKLNFKQCPELETARFRLEDVQTICDKLNAKIEDHQAKLRALQNQALANTDFQFMQHLKDYEEQQKKISPASFDISVEAIRKVLVKLIHDRKLTHPRHFKLSDYILVLSTMKAEQGLARGSLLRYVAAFNHFLRFLVNTGKMSHDDLRIIPKGCLSQVEKASDTITSDLVDLGSSFSLPSQRGEVKSDRIEKLTYKQLLAVVKKSEDSGDKVKMVVARAAYCKAMSELRKGAFLALRRANIKSDPKNPVQRYITPEVTIQRRKTELGEVFRIGTPNRRKNVPRIAPIWHRRYSDYIDFLIQFSEEQTKGIDIGTNKPKTDWLIPDPIPRRVRNKNHSPGALPFGQRRFTDIFKGLCREAKVPAIDVKNLRHTGVSLIEELTGKITKMSRNDLDKLSQKLAGHTSKKTTNKFYVKKDYVELDGVVYHGDLTRLFELGLVLDDEYGQTG
jgi:integrase